MDGEQMAVAGRAWRARQRRRSLEPLPAEGKAIRTRWMEHLLKAVVLLRVAVRLPQRFVRASSLSHGREPTQCVCLTAYESAYDRRALQGDGGSAPAAAGCYQVKQSSSRAFGADEQAERVRRVEPIWVKINELACPPRDVNGPTGQR